MSIGINKQSLFDKYLKLLGVERASPDFNLLKQIVKAHLIKVPFENISKLLYKKQGMNTLPDLETFLEGIEKYNFGGTCYTNNYYLFTLLEHLGYKIKLCGADMKNPDVHLISIVTLNGKEYIVDCGYAAPFFEPLPVTLNDDFIITFGMEKYIVKPKDEISRIKVEQYYENKLQHWYTAKPESRKIEDFRKVIRDSYSDDAVFMNAIRITKFTWDGSLVLKNHYFTKAVNGNSSTTKVNLEDIPALIEMNFGMPSSVVKKAVGHFKELKDIYS